MNGNTHYHVFVSSINLQSIMRLQLRDTNNLIQACSHHHLPQDVHHSQGMVVSFVDTFELLSIDVVGMDRMITGTTKYQANHHLHAKNGLSVSFNGLE